VEDRERFLDVTQNDEPGVCIGAEGGKRFFDKLRMTWGGIDARVVGTGCRRGAGLAGGVSMALADPPGGGEIGMVADGDW